MTPPLVDLSPAPGRYPFPLSSSWTAVALEPLAGLFVVGLFLDGDLVELVDDPPDVRGYLRVLGAVVGTTPRSRPQGDADPCRER